MILIHVKMQFLINAIKQLIYDKVDVAIIRIISTRPGAIASLIFLGNIGKLKESFVVK